MGFIAAALVTTSVYSQSSNNGMSNDQLLEQARQRLYEPQSNVETLGVSRNDANLQAPSGVSEQPNFSTQAGLADLGQQNSLNANGSPSNSSTGQSNGSNIGSSVTTDTDIATLEQPASRIEEGFNTDPSKVPAEERERSLLMNKTESGESAVGAPGESQTGSSSSSDSSPRSGFDNPDQTGAVRSDLTSRDDRFLNGADSKPDYDESLDQGAEVRTYNGENYWDQQNVGAPAGSQTGKMKSSEGRCDTDKVPMKNDSTVQSSGSAFDHDDQTRPGRALDSNRTNDASGNAAASEFGERSSDQVNSVDRAESSRKAESDEKSSSGSVGASGSAKDHDAAVTPDR